MIDSDISIYIIKIFFLELLMPMLSSLLIVEIAWTLLTNAINGRQ